jgi:hypothetical protein
MWLEIDSLTADLEKSEFWHSKFGRRSCCPGTTGFCSAETILSSLVAPGAQGTTTWSREVAETLRPVMPVDLVPSTPPVWRRAVAETLGSVHEIIMWMLRLRFKTQFLSNETSIITSLYHICETILRSNLETVEQDSQLILSRIYSLTRSIQSRAMRHRVITAVRELRLKVESWNCYE